MATFKNQNILVNTNCETVFEFLGDFRNFEELVPEQVKNWKADQESCSFTVEGMSDFNMRIDAKYPCRSMRIVSDGKNPATFTLDYFFHEKEPQSCEVSIVFEVSLNPFLKAIASKPLQNFVDMLGSKLQEKYA